MDGSVSGQLSPLLEWHRREVWLDTVWLDVDGFRKFCYYLFSSDKAKSLNSHGRLGFWSVNTSTRVIQERGLTSHGRLGFWSVVTSTRVIQERGSTSHWRLGFSSVITGPSSDTEESLDSSHARRVSLPGIDKGLRHVNNVLMTTALGLSRCRWWRRWDYTAKWAPGSHHHSLWASQQFALPHPNGLIVYQITAGTPNGLILDQSAAEMQSYGVWLVL